MTEDKRLIEIETKLAFQDQLVEQLNRVVVEQHKRIDELNVLCEQLRKRVQILSEQTAEDVVDEPPPHLHKVLNGLP